MENFWKREMIQEFSVTNFLSFKDKTTISFLATDDRKDKDILTYSPRRGVHLLRASMLIGANASGKSNLLRAMGALIKVVLENKTTNDERIIDYQPFATCNGIPTEFEIVVWIENIQYFYYIKYNATKILYESLNYSQKKGEILSIYERDENVNLTFGEKNKLSDEVKQNLKLNTLVNHTLLYTFRKITIEIPAEIEIFSTWLRNNENMFLMGNHSFNETLLSALDETDSNNNFKTFLIKLLKIADLNIEDFNVVDINISSPPGNLNLLDIKFFQFVSNNNSTQPYKTVLFKHKSNDGSEFYVPFNKESSGTLAFVIMSDILYSLIQGNSIFLIDEIETSLNAELLTHFISMYLKHKSNSQLIFTTHNISLIERDWLFRKDMIYIIEKNSDNSSSEVSRVSDYELPRNANIAKLYQNGRLGGQPNLGHDIVEWIL